MADLFKSKENEFYIELSQERYYFPGEDISGDVILDLKKATKTNNIRVTLEGTVEIGGRSMILFTKSAHIAESPEGDQKSHYLEPHTHRFPFRMTIPSSKDYKVPSTLEITKLLKVSYRLVAIYNKAYTLEKFCPTASVSINILEDINVDKAEFAGEQRIEKELLLSGETTRKVRVSTVVGKRAAVKGDVIPISVTIEHIGVMVRDKALSIQLLRSVYYGRNKSELFGPKVIRQITSNIEISGPISFTKTFAMQLPIPSNICPTVDKSGSTFKIEYSLRVSINLNEENPHRPETAGDIVIFNVPFVIGTYPKLAFNIDDDDDKEEEEQKADEESTSQKDDSSNYLEYEQVAEKMKDMDLGSEVNSPTLLQQSPSVKHTNSITRIDPTMASPQPSFESIHEPVPEPAVNKPNEIAYQAQIVSPPLDRIPSTNSTATTHFPTPKLENALQSGEPVEPSSPKPLYLYDQPTNKSPSFHHKQNLATSSNTPPPEHSTLVPSSPSYKAKLKITPSEIYNDYQPMVSPTTGDPTSTPVSRHDSVASLHPSTSTTTSSSVGVGRQESVRWIVRNQDAPTPAVISPQIPPRPTPSVSNQGGAFMMPTPSFSESTSTQTTHHSPPYHHNHYQHHDQSHHNNYGTSPPPPPLPQQFYNHSNHSMPMPQQQPQPQPQHHQFPPYTSNHYPYPDANAYSPYTSPPPPPSHPSYSGATGFPQPQPQPFSGGFMGMPSHQNYQPQPQYPFYNN
ncbi:hypothetical protein V8B55DRAFT_1485083 [Mucor lusitanicus]|uniref:Arrestin C-terminal-like domain-containing protein n=1 Tax=Mucor circinelloides f. lusitanicus TaxID=29924 RepID=A0A8H4B8D5_MUCCL|nr:hypothetical protein FB192DRAFT_1401847 [Mucor lusitanicus]